MNPGNKKKLTAAGVGWEEYEAADEWHRAGATRNKDETIWPGIQRHNTECKAEGK